jgi:hypothetical protein
MNIAFLRAGSKCVSLIAGGVLMAGLTFAAPLNPISVTLPHAVTVGATVLPAGHYTMSSIEMGGESLFVVRGDNNETVTLRGARVEDNSDKTEVTLTTDGDSWHFDKLTVAGESEAFQFSGSK